jgi:hypothetical protein
MRIPLAIAAFVVISSAGYRWSQGKPPTSRNLISWGVIFIILSALSLTEYDVVSDIGSYLIITVILLNDGYEIIGAL